MNTYRQCTPHAAARWAQRLAALALFVALFFAPSAYAQRSLTLWIVDAAPREAQEHEATLARVLGGARSASHIVGRAGIEEASRQGLLRVPGCLEGTRPCPPSTELLVMQSVGANMLVRLRVESTGKVHARAFDDQGEEIREVSAEGRTNQAAMSQVVAQLTGATGTLAIDSTPRGARVLLNGEDVGVTPLSRSIAIGAWDVEVTLEGWGAPAQTIVIPPDGSGRIHFTLERSLASLTVRSGTPDAYILIDGVERYELNERFWLSPGEHQVAVHAPGYTPNIQTMEFSAGIDRELRSTLYIARSELTRRRVETTRARPLMVQAGLRYSGFNSDWSTATLRGSQYDGGVACTLNDDGDCARTRIHGVGLDLETIYAWRYFELQPVGLSIYALPSPGTPQVRMNDDAATILQHDRANRLMLRLAHVGARYLVNEYFEPYARAGFSIAFDRIHMLDPATADTYSARRRAALIELRGGARARFNQMLYAYAEVGVGFELIAEHSAPAFEVAAGLGVNLADPFGRDRRAERRAQQRRESREEIPEEL